jgi:hypothetical protein
MTIKGAMVLKILIIVTTFYAVSFSWPKEEALVFAQTKEQEAAKAGQVESGYKASESTDPFQPHFNVQPVSAQPVVAETVVPTIPPPMLIISGVFWGGSFPQAIVNNKVVKEGDIIEGVKVISIKKDGLILSFANKEYNLSSPALTDLGGKNKEEEVK